MIQFIGSNQQLINCLQLIADTRASSQRDTAIIIEAADRLRDAADRLARIEAVMGSDLAYVTVKECIVSNVPFVTDAHYAVTAALAALRELIGEEK